MKSKLRQSVASVLIASVFSMGLPVPAQAGIVGTEAVADRERIAAVLEREEARTRLASYGVDRAEAKARVAALTDAEATRLAAEMDRLPAGAGGGEGFFVAVLVAYFVIEILPVILVVGGFVLIAKALGAGRSK